MFKCTYCDRELKSKAGKLRHESACEAREIGGQTEEEIAELPSMDLNTLGEIMIAELNEKKPEVVQLEVMNGADTYYMGHPRRLTKLKGMLSATFDKTERRKIFNMIKELENGKV